MQKYDHWLWTKNLITQGEQCRNVTINKDQVKWHKIKKKKKMEEYTKETSKTGNASYEVREEKGLHIGSTQIFTGAYLTPVIRHVECS